MLKPRLAFSKPRAGLRLCVSYKFPWDGDAGASCPRCEPVGPSSPASLKSLLICHLLRETFPDHLIWNVLICWMRAGILSVLFFAVSPAPAELWAQSRHSNICWVERSRFDSWGKGNSGICPRSHSLSKPEKTPALLCLDFKALALSITPGQEQSLFTTHFLLRTSGPSRWRQSHNCSVFRGCLLCGRWPGGDQWAQSSQWKASEW